MPRRPRLAGAAAAVLAVTADAACVLVHPTRTSDVPQAARVGAAELAHALSALRCDGARVVGSAKSLAEAQQAARASANAADPEVPFDVVLLPGRHVLRQTLQLTAADSGMTWRAAVAGTAVVSGDELVQGWGMCPPGILSDPASPALCAAVDFANASARAQARHLYGADGRRLPRAQSLPEVVKAFQSAAADGDKYTVEPGGLPAGLLSNWVAAGAANNGAIEMVYTAQGSPWTESRCTVLNVSAGAGGSVDVFMKQPCFQSLQQKPCGQGTHTPVLVENAMADDLAPGQWYLHRPASPGAGQQCAADFGSATACCGQSGQVPPAYQCPATAPVCSDYVYDAHYGVCGEAARSSAGTAAAPAPGDAAVCHSDKDCPLPCPAGEVGRCVAGGTCACVTQASTTIYAVYYPLPGETVTANTAMHMPVLETLTAADGANDVGFVGLVFEYATWSRPSGPLGYVEQQSGALVSGVQPGCVDYLWEPMPSNVVFHHTKGVAVSGCTFQHLGAGAVQFDGGAHDNAVTASRFQDVSGTAIQLGRYDTFNVTDPALQEQGNVLADNAIHGVAAEYHGNAGISIGYSKDTVVARNDIANVTYSGISIGWGWSREQNTYARNNTVGNNRIRGFKLQTPLASLGDGGGIYALGPQLASTMRGNWVSEMGSGRGGGAFYPDEGSAYWTISENVFSDAVFCADDCQWLHIWTASIHDINTTGCFTDTPTQDVAGTNTPVVNTTVVPKSTPLDQWPAAAQAIMAAAGPSTAVRAAWAKQQQQRER